MNIEIECEKLVSLHQKTNYYDGGIIVDLKGVEWEDLLKSLVVEVGIDCIVDEIGVENVLGEISSSNMKDVLKERGDFNNEDLV